MEEAYTRAVYALARVGYTGVAGYLAESLTVWKAYGLPVTSGDVQDITPTDLNLSLIHISRRPRRNSCRPSPASSSLICWLTADWVM